MLVVHNGNEYNVTNKFALEQLLKYGAVLVKEEVTEKAVIITEEMGTEKPKTRNKK